MSSIINPVKKIKILERQSEFCKLFTNVYRLEILYVLTHDLDDTEIAIELSVSQILEKIHEVFDTDLSQTTLSQHIAILRNHHVLIARRDGNNIFYKVASPKIIDACCLVREIVIDQLKKTASITDDLPENVF